MGGDAPEQLFGSRICGHDSGACRVTDFLYIPNVNSANTLPLEIAPPWSNSSHWPMSGNTFQYPYPCSHCAMASAPIYLRHGGDHLQSFGKEPVLPTLMLFSSRTCGSRLKDWTNENKRDNKRVKVAAANGIPAIVQALRRYEQFAVVQEYGCWALWYLAWNIEKNQIAIAQADGIGAIVAAMRQHNDATEVQCYGCRALIELAQNNAQNQIAIAEAGVFGAIIVAGMRQHTKASRMCNSMAARLLVALPVKMPRTRFR
jgi:hypothetical protein